MKEICKIQFHTGSADAGLAAYGKPDAFFYPFCVCAFDFFWYHYNAVCLRKISFFWHGI